MNQSSIWPIKNTKKPQIFRVIILNIEVRKTKKTKRNNYIFMINSLLKDKLTF